MMDLDDAKRAIGRQVDAITMQGQRHSTGELSGVFDGPVGIITRDDGTQQPWLVRLLKPAQQERRVRASLTFTTTASDDEIDVIIGHAEIQVEDPRDNDGEKVDYWTKGVRSEWSAVTVDDDPDEDEEGPTYHGIVRYTHVHCGYTTRKRSEMEILNDGDPACPKCSDNSSPRGIPDYAYGAIVWEMADGTLVETYSNGQELTRWQPVRTHVDIYKSWVNGPEWWIVPRPNTGDIDGSDNLIVAYPTWELALAAATTPALRELFDELAGADGIAWRYRHNPIYQITRTEGRF